MDFLLSMLLQGEVSCQYLHAFMPSLEISLSTARLLPDPIHKTSATYFRVHCRSTLLLHLKFFLYLFFLPGASWDFGLCSNSTSVFHCCVISHSKRYWCKPHPLMWMSPIPSPHSSLIKVALDAQLCPGEGKGSLTTPLHEYCLYLTP